MYVLFITCNVYISDLVTCEMYLIVYVSNFFESMLEYFK